MNPTMQDLFDARDEVLKAFQELKGEIDHVNNCFKTFAKRMGDVDLQLAITRSQITINDAQIKTLEAFQAFENEVMKLKDENNNRLSATPEELAEFELIEWEEIPYDGLSQEERDFIEADLQDADLSIVDFKPVK